MPEEPLGASRRLADWLHCVQDLRNGRGARWALVDSLGGGEQLIAFRYLCPCRKTTPDCTGRRWFDGGRGTGFSSARVTATATPGGKSGLADTFLRDTCL